MTMELFFVSITKPDYTPKQLITPRVGVIAVGISACVWRMNFQVPFDIEPPLSTPERESFYSIRVITAEGGRALSVNNDW